MSETRIIDVFGANLRRARLSGGFRLADVAEAVGVSIPHVSKIERGQNVPSIETADRLAYAVGATLPEMVTPEATGGKERSRKRC